MLGGGNQAGAQGDEDQGAGEGAHAPRHLLLDLRRADVPFRGVVVRRNSQVAGEAQVVIEAAGHGAMAAADRPGRAGVARGADPGLPRRSAVGAQPA